MTPTHGKDSERKKSKNADRVVVPFNAQPQKSTDGNGQISTAETITSFGDLLNSAYGVLRLILEQMEWPDLLNASKVCRTWNELAERINSERLEPEWFHLNDPIVNNKKGRFSIVYTKSPQLSRPALSLVFINEQADIAYCCRFMPRDGCFVSCDKHHRLMQYVEYKLQPSGGHVVGLCCNAVKASFICPERKLTALQNEERAVMVGIVIPKIPNVQIAKFFIEDTGNVQESFEDLIGRGNHVKCLLAFIGVKHRLILRQSMIVERLVTVINNHQPSTPFAVGGGVVQSSKDSDFHQGMKRNRGGVMCITFSSPANTDVDFDASSVILWETARTESQIDLILKHLAKGTVRRQYRVALRFACVSRHNKSNLELKCFKKFFPDVYLIGFEGLGEIGLAHISQTCTDSDNKRQCVDRQVIHANTTIIVLLSWGKQIHK